MSLKFWQTKSFKKLQKKWEENLRQSRFCDAEKLAGEFLMLRQHASNSYRSAPKVVRESKQRYYELLGHGYSGEEFSDPVEKIVMERKSNGISIKQISIELKTLNQRSHRETIRHIIQKYEVKWGLRKQK